MSPVRHSHVIWEDCWHCSGILTEHSAVKSTNLDDGVSSRNCLEYEGDAITEGGKVMCIGLQALLSFSSSEDVKSTPEKDGKLVSGHTGALFNNDLLLQ